MTKKKTQNTKGKSESTPENRHKTILIEINRIEAEDNPRQVFSKREMDELTDSVRIHGILQPLLVTPVNNHFRLVAGRRRLKAAQKAGLKEVPVYVRDIKGEKILDIQIEENLRRQNLNPMEEAIAIKKFLEDREMPLEELSARLNKSVTFLKDRLKLTELHQDAQKLLLKGKMNFVQAKILATLTHEDQLDLLKGCKDEVLESIPAGEFQQMVEQNFTLNLEHAAFDKTECASCGKKSDAQSEFFVEPEEIKSHCLDRRCFQQKRETEIIRQIEECRENGNRILTDEEFEKIRNERSVVNFGNYKPYNISDEDWQGCLKCANMGVYADSSDIATQGLSHLCLNKKCYREKTAATEEESEEQTSNGSQSDHVLTKRLIELRRKWLVNISESLVNNPLYKTALALCSIQTNHNDIALYKRHGLELEYFTSMGKAVEYILANHKEDARDRIESLLKDVVQQRVSAIKFDDSTLIALSEMLEENYSRRFVINEDFLKIHTIAQLHELAVEIGLDKHLQSPKEPISESDRKKRYEWRKASKKDLINLFLQTDFKLEGIVPKAVANLK